MRDRREDEEDEGGEEKGAEAEEEDAALLSDDDYLALACRVINPLSHSVACVIGAHANEHRYVTYGPRLLPFITF